MPPIKSKPCLPCSADDFTQITVATAKCDLCNKRDKRTMKRCNTCSFQLCGGCTIKSGNEGAH
ncbi:hypothetical protein C7212DRAFT_313062 [Tuber magnatum]|uniref:Uncharacterized protein n=1 Tax=Tuber magnatum TaxID=42249 RepID=A0A317SUF1_9PEZI|nr:hypothetical protein C7212DRAFT_313062 [Tuber magnatum]